MKLSYKEKTIWITLISAFLIYGYYFSKAIKAIHDPEVLNVLFILLIWITVIYIIIQIIAHSVIAIIHRKEAVDGGDERDKLISFKSTRISYAILILGVWVIVGGTFIWSSPLLIANMLIFFFILAEIVGSIFQLIYYRRGV